MSYMLRLKILTRLCTYFTRIYFSILHYAAQDQILYDTTNTVTSSAYNNATNNVTSKCHFSK